MTVESVNLGFTEITAANVQQAPQRMIGSLGALDPIRKFARITAPTLVVHSELDRRRAPCIGGGRGDAQPGTAAGAGFDGAFREGDVPPPHPG